MFLNRGLFRHAQCSHHQTTQKVVGGKSILKSIDLAVRPGEFLTLVGPSGCGKSTLLRVISGLTEFTSGSVLIDDKEVSELAPRERGVAMVFQSYALYPHMSVAENIATPLNMAELSSLERAPLIGRLFGAENDAPLRIASELQPDLLNLNHTFK